MLQCRATRRERAMLRWHPGLTCFMGSRLCVEIPANERDLLCSACVAEGLDTLVLSVVW